MACSHSRLPLQPAERIDGLNPPWTLILYPVAWYGYRVALGTSNSFLNLAGI